MKQQKDEKVLTKYQIRRQLIDDIVENGAKTALSKFRRSDRFNGRIVLDFANLRGVNFEGAYLVDVSFIGTDLRSVIFRDNLFYVSNSKIRTSFRGALCMCVDFSEQKLCEIDFAYVNFTDSILKNVDFSGCNLRGTVFDYTNCFGAVFDEAVLMRPFGEKDLTNNQDDDEKASFVFANISMAKFSKGAVMDVNKITAESAESTEVYLVKKKERYKTAVKNSKKIKRDKLYAESDIENVFTS
ncbi:MAG: pentapeptide repeat-containing protein [Candidatus Magasanikbacteria bacterium]|nr:pentapeptide repeat-containing protein [Candidatus Magasanikbacteria bacterium]